MYVGGVLNTEEVSTQGKGFSSVLKTLLLLLSYIKGAFKISKHAHKLSSYGTTWLRAPTCVNLTHTHTQ